MGKYLTVVVGGVGRIPAKQLGRHLEARGRPKVELEPHTRRFAERLRTADATTAGIFVLRNAASHVAQVLDRGGSDPRAAIDGWNDQLRLAAALVKEGRMIAVGFEDLFLRGTGWDRIRRYLGVPVTPNTPAEAPTATLDAATLDDILRFGDLALYKTLLADPAQPPQRRRQAAIRMYHEDEAAYDYDYQDIGARIALRRTLGQDIPDEPDIVCLGSAAVFGRFADDPFPQLIARDTKLKVANLGYGGARPEVYLSDPVLMDLIERAKLVVVELMSGRGYENDMLVQVNPVHNAVTIKAEYQDVLKLAERNKHLFVDRPWDRAFVDLLPEDVAHLVAQSAGQLEKDLAELLARSRKAIVFHFAQEPLPERIDAKTYRFPHLVTRDLAERVAQGRPFVSVVSKTGVPSKITNRSTGAPEPLMGGWPDPTVNAYYPSPEMHREAADALKPFLIGL